MTIKSRLLKIEKTAGTIKIRPTAEQELPRFLAFLDSLTEAHLGEEVWVRSGNETVKVLQRLPTDKAAAAIEKTKEVIRLARAGLLPVDPQEGPIMSVCRALPIEVVRAIQLNYTRRLQQNTP
jgi:hypothetical protein